MVMWCAESKAGRVFGIGWEDRGEEAVSSACVLGVVEWWVVRMCGRGFIAWSFVVRCVFELDKIELYV